MRCSQAYGFILLFLPSLSFAGVFDWQSNNIQLLRGFNYTAGEKQRTIVTLEHVHGWALGDTFAFIDYIYPDGQQHGQNKSTYYAEIAPRLSLSKITGYDFSYGIVKDILISTTFEKARGKRIQYLYGGAVDLNLPGFKFFKFNAYVHDNPVLEGQTWLVTLVWNYPFEISNKKFLIEGFADLQGAEGRFNSNELIVPRLLVDVGDLLGCKQSKLMAGIEYQYWHNKFGIDGVTESVVQAQVKWVF